MDKSCQGTASLHCGHNRDRLNPVPPCDASYGCKFCDLRGEWWRTLELGITGYSSGVKELSRRAERAEVFIGCRFAGTSEASILSGQSTPKVRVSGAQLQAIENQLFALARQQAKRNQPIDLPRPDFWSQVATLLSNIEMELVEVGHNEGWSVKAQNLSRRQANVRRAVADLTQHRLTAFVRHASTSKLASAPFGDAPHDSKAQLAALDWSRQDVAERAFHEGLSELIERYKRQVSWTVMQQGVAGGERPTPTIQAGTPQLDSYVDEAGGLTGQGPPKVEVIEEALVTYEDPDEDEEDRISRMDAYPSSASKSMGSEPTVEPAELISAPTQEVVEDDASTDQNEDMIRIRILQDLDEPIIDADGNELELLTGDVEFCDADFASGLIAAGLAEDASI